MLLILTNRRFKFRPGYRINQLRFLAILLPSQANDGAVSLMTPSELLLTFIIIFSSCVILYTRNICSWKRLYVCNINLKIKQYWSWILYYFTSNVSSNILVTDVKNVCEIISSTAATTASGHIIIYNTVKPRFIVFVGGPEKNDGCGKTIDAGPI
jgi:hypothetical protein